MKQYYESEVLYKLMERDGFNIPSSVPPYESEIKAYLINQVKQAYPKLTDYEAEWLLYNYTKHLPADFPINSVSNVSTATFKNVVPFAYQSAILKGQTLVNLCETSGKDLVYTDTNSTTMLNHPIEKNKWYYMIINVKQNTFEKPFRFSGWSFANGCKKMEGSQIGTYDIDVFNGGETGVKGFKLGYSEMVDGQGKALIMFVGKNSGETLTGKIVYDIMFLEYQEGMENWDIPYFEGMQSVKMPVLKTTGKNLFNGKLEVGNINSGNGETYVVPYMRITDFIKINENKAITLSKLNNSDIDFKVEKVAYYDTNKNYMSSNGELFMFPKTLTPPTGVAYIRVVFCKGDWDTTATEEDFKTLQVQLEEGSTATPYESYRTNILTVNEEVELRGIGDVKDTLDCLTGEVTQCVGEIVLDGSEQWRLVRTGESTFLFGCDDYIIGTSTTSSQSHICNTFKVCAPDANGGIWDRDEESIAFKDNDTNKIRIRILKSKVSDLISFKSWLSSNPVTVQYKLTEKVHKTVDLTTVNENGEKVYFMPLEGTMNVTSSSETIQPTFDMSVPVEATTQNLASFINMKMEE